MKKIIKIFGKVFHPIGSFFDKWLITPITKLILKITNFFKNNSKSIERTFNQKSTLIIISLILAFGVFLLIDKESNVENVEKPLIFKANFNHNTVFNFLTLFLYANIQKNSAKSITNSRNRFVNILFLI